MAESEQKEIINKKIEIRWRNTGARVMFFIFDSSVFYFLLILLYSFTLSALIFSLICVFILIILEKRGYTLPNAFRKARIIFTGRYKAAVENSRRMNIHY